MSSIIYRTVVIFGLVILCCAVIVPNLWAFQPVNNRPWLGNRGVYDGGRRAQWRGQFFGTEIWMKSDSKLQQAPGQTQASPGTEVQTGAE